MIRLVQAVLWIAACVGCAASGTPPQASVQGSDETPEPSRMHFYADLAVGAGTYEHETDGSNLDDDTDGGYLRLRTEFLSPIAIGGGIALEGAASDDDLFEDQGVIDGEGGIGDLFLYFLAVPVETDGFRLPLRVGPYFHSMSFEEDATDTDVEWDGFGMRVEAEPELWFVRHDDFSFGMSGDLSAGIHVTEIDFETTGFDEDFDGDGITLGAGLGVQAMFGAHVTAKLGYVYRLTSESESDSNNGIKVFGADTSFRGIVAQIGLRF